MSSPTPTPTPPPVPSRMRLDSLVTGRQKKPIRIVLYGEEGIGKSTFGSEAPAPVFIGAEDGTANLDVKRFEPETWLDIREALRQLASEKHAFKTVILDTLDWAEPKLWNYICQRDSKASIEDYGFGKGYNAALDEWRLLVSDLEKVRSAGMNIILIAHSAIKTFKNPSGPDYDRYQLKINGLAAALLKEWSDTVLFARFETFAVENEKTKRVKGVSSGARLIHTVKTASYDAKNRNNLPESMPLEWETFAAALEADGVDPVALKAEIERKAKELGGDLGKKALDSLAKHAADPVKLAQLNSKLNAKLMEKGN